MNWWAVIGAAVVYYLLGGLWFSPMAFGNLWDKAMGFERPEGWRAGSIFFVGPFIGCLAASIATAVLIRAARVQSFVDAALLGLIAGLGYGAAISIVNAISPTIPRPVLFGAITGIYHAIGIVIASVIVFAIS